MFSSQKGAEGGCDSVGQQHDRHGRRSGFHPAWGLLVCYFCSAPILWFTMCAKLISDPSSLCSHAKCEKLLSHLFCLFWCALLPHSTLLSPSRKKKSENKGPKMRDKVVSVSRSSKLFHRAAFRSYQIHYV